MPAQLIALTDGPDILLDKPILLLGRHPECDIQIDSRKISRRHCCIAQVEDYLVVRDLGSTNGIRINGVRVQEGRLRPSDELTIGNSRYKVKWDTMEPSPAPIRQNQAARPGRLEAIDDAVLESCEEPVPLEDPEPVVQPVRPKVLPRPTQVESDPEPGLGDSLILPEELELAPLSDVIPPPGSAQ